MTRAKGVRNINGGDSRFDSEYPSYTWVRPLGRSVGDQFQVYSSNSNENTYTKLWTDHFYGFNKLPETFKNTETPIRVKPANVYYHMFSGQKLASLMALRQNLEYIRSQEVIPIATSRFAGIVDGFNSTKIFSIGKNSWKIEERGALQTFRFDRAALSSVDFTKSDGVVGQRHFQGSLYVYLDKQHEAPVITLKKSTTVHEEPRENTIYLINSQWRVWDVQRHQADHISFTTQGYGTGTMQWKVPDSGTYVVFPENIEVQSENGQIAVTISNAALEPRRLTIQRK